MKVLFDGLDALARMRLKNDVVTRCRGDKGGTRVSVKPVRICDEACIGFNAIVLEGVTLGEGTVVGAGSVVTQDVRPSTVAADNPARPIRTLEASAP